MPGLPGDGINGKNNTLGHPRAHAVAYDLVVLDTALRGPSGLEVLRAMRDQRIEEPVLLLTASRRPEETVTGLWTRRATSRAAPASVSS